MSTWFRARTESDREQLARELTAAEAKLVRQQKDSAATQRRTTEIQEALNEEA
ncbi:hypothetical protein ABZ953_20100 [Streptomyces sp. NPDC046465]|uniref:hypothetical protein n=1 Tax=Streptomyces sp. NPDC046465 TaxID=3155810 RepID=UPI0033E1118D